MAALRRANDDTMLLFQDQESQDRLLDLGEGRLRQMDLIGLDRMVLSVTHARHAGPTPGRGRAPGPPGQRPASRRRADTPRPL